MTAIGEHDTLTGELGRGGKTVVHRGLKPENILVTRGHAMPPARHDAIARALERDPGFAPACCALGSPLVVSASFGSIEPTSACSRIQAVRDEPRFRERCVRVGLAMPT